MRRLSLALLAMSLIAGEALAQTPAEQRAILRDFERSAWAYAEQFEPMGEEATPTASSNRAIFTMPVSMVFRQIIAAAFGKPYVPAMSAPERLLEPRVMVWDPFPLADSTALPDLLTEVLPLLPPGLEYRFVGRDLVLRDTVRNLVVAVLRDAIRHTATTTQHN